ncbi:MAG: hypothetical protein V4478_01065 [Patescibacteria group bacterium]
METQPASIDTQLLAALRTRIIDCAFAANLTLEKDYKLSGLQKNKTYFTVELLEAQKTKFAAFKKYLNASSEHKPTITGAPPSFIRIDFKNEYEAGLGIARKEKKTVKVKKFAYEKNGVKYEKDYLPEPPKILRIKV